MSTATKVQKVVLIHTTPVAEEIFRDAGAHFPTLEVEHRTETPLFDLATSTPGLEFDRCVLELCRRVDEAAAGGAEAVLVTCSTLGAASDVVNAISSIPVVRIDRPMAVEAVRYGGSIGLIATQESNFASSVQILKDAAREAGKEGIEIKKALRTEAFDALTNNDRAFHDQLIGELIDELATEVDVVVLAQASMASAASRPASVPVLTSPAAALRSLGEAVDSLAKPSVPITTPALDQLRIYTIREGLMEMWLEYFHRVIVPLHEAVGIPVAGPWRNTADENEFVWIRSFSGDRPVEEQENRFFTSPARVALGDVRERYVEDLTVRVLTKS